MKPQSSITCCLLLLLAVPAWGQSPPKPAGGKAPLPLNLSLPRDALVQPSSMIRNDTDETATRNLRQESEDQAKQPAHQRYGTGYEARQRGMAAETGSGSGFGSGSGSGSGMSAPMGGSAGMGGAGMGGSGRGGMGRGR